MASDYLKWKYRDVQPDAPPPERSKPEKARNWLYYHKWWMLAGAALLWILGSILWNALGIGQIKPDYRFAYVGRQELPEALCEELQSALAAVGADVNGDRRVTVELRQYATERNADSDTALAYRYAADTLLLADITAGESYFFLTDDPERLQRSYQILARWDGSPPEDEDLGTEDKVFRWSDCPVLSSLETGQAQLADLYFGRRCFYEDGWVEAQKENDAFWLRLTKGATR